MRPLIAQDIKSLYRAATHSELGLPDLSSVDWGVLDYLGWVHPSGHTAYVVMEVGMELKAIRLRRALATEGPPRTQMCSWCHHVYRGRGTALFTTTVLGSDGRRNIGNYLCRNLDCSLRIRNLTSDSPTYLPESLHVRNKIYRLQAAVLTFMARANVLN